MYLIGVGAKLCRTMFLDEQVYTPLLFFFGCESRRIQFGTSRFGGLLFLKSPTRALLLKTSADCTNVTVTCNTAKYGDPYSEFVQSAHTHTKSNRQPFMLRCPGSSCGFSALLKGTSVVVLRVENEHCTFTPSTYNPCWPETRTHNLWITSPTL